MVAMNRAFVHLRVRMLVFVLLAFVPALLLTLLTFKEQRREGTDEAKDAALRLARAAAISYERLTVQTQSMLAALDLAWLNDFAANADLPPGSTITVLDRKGTILARFPDPDRWVGKTEPEAPIVAAIVKGREGTADAPGLDAVPRLFGFVPLRTGPGETALFLSVGIPRAAALVEATHHLIRNALLVTLFGALALLAAWAGGSHFLFNPVNRLIMAAERLGRGELTVRSGLPHDVGEFGRLASTFDRMATALEGREAQLGQAREA